MTQSSDLERENRARRAAGSDSVPGHPSNGRLRIAMTRAVSSAAFVLLLGGAAVLAGCGSSGGSAPSASEPEVMATPVPASASASAPVAEVRAEPSPSATAPAITAVTAGPSPPAATPAATPAPTRSVTPPAQPTRSPGPTPEATQPAVKTAAPTTAAPTTAAPTPEPTEAPAAGQPTASTAKRRGSARDAPDPTATPGQDSGLEAVVRNAISNLGAVYTWQDGEHTRRARLVPALTVQGSASTITSDVVLANDGVRSIVQRQARHGNVAGPVFLAESGGGLMLLPGGVVLALDPEWDEAHVDRFFSDSGIARSRVTRGEFAENGFLVETEAGFASLTLANALAGKAGVLFSVPNWQRQSVPR